MAEVTGSSPVSSTPPGVAANPRLERLAPIRPGSVRERSVTGPARWFRLTTLVTDDPFLFSCDVNA